MRGFCSACCSLPSLSALCDSHPKALTDPAAVPAILQSLAALVGQPQFTYGAPVFTAIALLLFVGAAGKSSQIPLYVGCPMRWKVPRRSGALIHAATMVTAGVYLIERMSAIYQLAPVAMDVVAIIGAATAIFAATMAVVQTDIQ